MNNLTNSLRIITLFTILIITHTLSFAQVFPSGDPKSPVCDVSVTPIPDKPIEYYFNLNPSDFSKSEYGGDAGTLENVTGTYNEITKKISFKFVAGKDANGTLPNSAFFVMNNGRNPRDVGISGYVAIVYVDLRDLKDVKLVVYGYSGENGPDSWKHGSTQRNGIPDPIISSYYNSSWVTKRSAVVNDGKLLVDLVFDATEIIKHVPGPAFATPGVKWYGIGFDEKIGLWLHTFTNSEAVYNTSGETIDSIPPGFLSSYSSGAVTYFDIDRVKTTDCLGRVQVPGVPAPVFDACCICGGDGKSCKESPKCHTIDFRTAEYWRNVLEKDKLPKGVVIIPGVNYGNGTSTSNKNAIMQALREPTGSPTSSGYAQKHFTQTFVSAQLDMLTAGGPSIVSDILWGVLSCFGCIKDNYLLSNGVVINSASLMMKVFHEAESLAKSNIKSVDDARTLATLFTNLQNCSRQIGEPVVSYVKYKKAKLKVVKPRKRKLAKKASKKVMYDLSRRAKIF